MTRKQATLNLSASEGDDSGDNANGIRRITNNRPALKIITASADELLAHQERLAIVANKGGVPLWQK